MSQHLFVFYEQQIVGLMTQTASSGIQFQYDPSWVASPGRFPISLSLPLDGSFSATAGHHFFANLLPEGSVRQQICKSLKISPSNDFELLKAIGGDCAGALCIRDSETDLPIESEPRYIPISEEQLALWSLGTPDAFSGVTGQNDVRLSLAGAQDKLPVHVEGNQIFIPQGNAPSTYILKFASPHYSHLPENEAFITLLANQVGLSAVDVQVRRTTKASMNLIARYDRQLISGRWQRLHQEDFCQALGINASRKYEKEGGPGLKQCVDVIRKNSAYPLLDLQRLMQWAFFNLFVANADAHGKNLSLLYSSNGPPTLAPFYDLICTRNYKNLSREMAMNFGGAWNPDFLTTKHFDRLADDFGFRNTLVLQEAGKLSQQIYDTLPTAIEVYGNRFGASPVLERLPMLIRKQIRRVNSQLKR